ncbi:MAG: outer membrane lipoprotein-sorting protein [Salinisphaeraceae bacterium]|nr:outer membrane lipoprotein-sorting protein [Salinisphaeraceae bacterium]
MANLRGLVTRVFCVLAVSVVPVATVSAKVSAEEAAKLGDTLTPVGAIKKGNDEGSIPEWNPWPQKGDLSGQDLTAENFPDTIGKLLEEEPKTVLTKDNYSEHADKLTKGHQALFELYPDYRMQVYPTHRNVGYPEEVYKYSKTNATTSYMDGCNDCVRDAEFGFPFPIPKNGVEVMWNHRLRWRGEHVERNNDQAIVQQSGSKQVTKLVENVKFPYTLLGGEHQRIDDKDDIMIYYQSETTSPPRNAGQYLLAWEHVGYRSAWLYNPGLRRVRRAPNVQYDNPYEGTDGQQFYDQVDMYNGAMDRYDYKLVGKKEMLIPYNNYAINQPDLEYEADLLGDKHLNQDLMRYELHRVWVVDATLRDGTSHQFKRRTFYIDEDGWNIVAVDCYDNRDDLWKFQEAANTHLTTGQFVGGAPELIYDLQSGLYFATAMINEGKPNDFSVAYDDQYFSAQALKRRTSR